jgi:hypothetical protein
MPKEKNDKNKKNEEERPVRSFTWGDDSEKRDVVPQFIKVRLVLWNSTASKEFAFDTIIPIFSYPTEKKDAKSEEKKETTGKKDEKIQQK